MTSKEKLEQQVATAAQEQGIYSTLLRNVVSRKLGLNITDMECLSLLISKGISTPKELAHFTGMTPGSATIMLDRLENAKYTSRKPNPNDRRGVLIEIDKESMKKIYGMFAAAQAAQRELIASYSEKELETIADFLTHFAENTKKHKELLEGTSGKP
jgi:DNA-binding MarR family transcriptional regulator